MAKMLEVRPDVVPIRQPNTATCWLASAQMMYRWRGYPPTVVEEILRAAEKNDPRVKFDFWHKNGIAHEDLIPLASALSLCAGPGGQAQPVHMVNQIRDRGPLLAVGAWNTYSHVIVVTGVEDEKDPKYPGLTKIKLVNPWTGSVEVSTLDWFNGGLGHWCGVRGQYMHWA